jgi:hypothetical protein
MTNFGFVYPQAHANYGHKPKISHHSWISYPHFDLYIIIRIGKIVWNNKIFIEGILCVSIKICECVLKLHKLSTAHSHKNSACKKLPYRKS